VTKTLEQFIYGRPIIDDQLADDPTILALSDGLTLEQALVLRAQTVLEPSALSSEIPAQAVGVFAGLNGDYLLARAHYQQDDTEQPVYQYVALPGVDYRQLAGDLSPLMRLIETPIPVYTDRKTPVTTLDFPQSETRSMEQQITLFESVAAQYGGFLLPRWISLSRKPGLWSSKSRCLNLSLRSTVVSSGCLSCWQRRCMNVSF
jgi:hypothetical protein